MKTKLCMLIRYTVEVCFYRRCCCSSLGLYCSQEYDVLINPFPLHMICYPCIFILIRFIYLYDPWMSNRLGS